MGSRIAAFADRQGRSTLKSAAVARPTGKNAMRHGLGGLSALLRSNERARVSRCTIAAA